MILPQALKKRDPDIILNFEKRYEFIGIPALLVQVLTGVWLAYLALPDMRFWIQPNDFYSYGIATKLGLLLLTIAFAQSARFRIVPNLTAKGLPGFAWHIYPVTIIAILFVCVGVILRSGGIY